MREGRTQERCVGVYQQRKFELRAVVKIPENMHSNLIRFGALASQALALSNKHQRDQRNVISRIKRITQDFGDRAADWIKPGQIDQWADNRKRAAIANSYRALFSLVFREACATAR